MRNGEKFSIPRLIFFHKNFNVEKQLKKNRYFSLQYKISNLKLKFL